MCNTYVRVNVCARARARAARSFSIALAKIASGWLMVVTDGRGPSAMPEERIPENSGREIGGGEKGGKRVSALRLPPRPLPDPRGEHFLRSRNETEVTL